MWVIGGAEIFEAFMDRADRIELTTVRDHPEGDTTMPAPLPTEWLKAAQEDHDGYSFGTVERRRFP